MQRKAKNLRALESGLNDENKPVKKKYSVSAYQVAVVVFILVMGFLHFTGALYAEPPPVANVQQAVVHATVAKALPKKERPKPRVRQKHRPEEKEQPERRKRAREERKRETNSKGRRPTLARAYRKLPGQKDASDFDNAAGFEEYKITQRMERMEKQLRKLKASGVVMETNEDAKRSIDLFQQEVRKLLAIKFKKLGVTEPVQIAMDVEFPANIIDGEDRQRTLTLELAPSEHVPYSAYYWLMITEEWKGGYFHRNAGHVMQAHVNSHRPPVAFQEYSPHFPHEQYTMGLAGRPGGPEFYISTIDNTNNHGPASQGSSTEADVCFAKVVEGQEFVKLMMNQKGGDNMGFVAARKNWITITRMEVVQAKIAQ